MFMKIFLLIASVTVATAQSGPSWIDVVEECAIENGFGPDMNPNDADKVEGCALACVMKRLDTIDETGHWKVEKIIALLPKEYPNYDDFIGAMRQCAPLIGETDCDTPPLLRDCLAKKLPCSDDYECAVASYQLLFLQPDMIHPDGQQLVAKEFHSFVSL